MAIDAEITIIVKGIGLIDFSKLAGQILDLKKEFPTIEDIRSVTKLLPKDKKVI